MLPVGCNIPTPAATAAFTAGPATDENLYPDLISFSEYFEVLREHCSEVSDVWYVTRLCQDLGEVANMNDTEYLEWWYESVNSHHSREAILEGWESFAYISDDDSENDEYA